MNIEFVDPVLPSRRTWLCLMAVAALAAVLFAAEWIMEVRAATLANHARARAEGAVVLQTSPAPISPPPYADDMRRVLDRAALPEGPVMIELETVAVDGVQLTSIDISMANHVATVELEAGSDLALGSYLDQLNAGLQSPVWHIDHLAAATNAAPTTLNGSITPDAQSVTLKRRF